MIEGHYRNWTKWHYVQRMQMGRIIRGANESRREKFLTETAQITNIQLDGKVDYLGEFALAKYRPVEYCWLRKEVIRHAIVGFLLAAVADLSTKRVPT